MPWSQEIQSNASFSIQGDHNQVARAADQYENQQGIEYIHPKIRSIEFLETLQSPAYENQGIDHIRSSIRSTVLLETLQSSAYENQGMEYIHTTIRSPAVLQTLKPPEYENQGIEFIHMLIRSMVFSETTQAQMLEYIKQPDIEGSQSRMGSTVFSETLGAPECEKLPVTGHIQARNLTALSFKALQELEYEHQQGIEYIHEKQRSRTQEDMELLSFYSDVLEAVEYGDHYCIEDSLCEEQPKLYDFVKQYGFDNMESLLKNGTYKIKNRPDTDIEMEKKALVLKICDAIERSRMSVQCDHAKQRNLDKPVQARIRSEVVHAGHELKDHEGNVSIQVQIRSETLSEESLDQYKKQKEDSHIEANMRPTTSFATKSPPRNVKLQKMHNIRTKEYQQSMLSNTRVNKGSSIPRQQDRSPYKVTAFGNHQETDCNLKTPEKRRLVRSVVFRK